MPEFHIVGLRTHSLYLKYKRYFPSRRAAFRAAKRDAGIPMSQHPEKVVRPRTPEGTNYEIDDRNVRLYVFFIFIGAVFIEVHIREDKPDKRLGQPKHFNAGNPPDKLKEHYFWNDDES
jgi:hypothetical protein